MDWPSLSWINWWVNGSYVAYWLTRKKNVRFLNSILFSEIVFYFRRRICWTQEKLRAKPSSSSHDHHLPISGAAGKNNFFASLALYKIFLNCSSIKSWIIQTSFLAKICNWFCNKNMEPLCKQQNITFHDANQEYGSQRSLFSFHVLYMLLKLSWLCIKSFCEKKVFSSYNAFP